MKLDISESCKSGDHEQLASTGYHYCPVDCFDGCDCNCHYEVQRRAIGNK